MGKKSEFWISIMERDKLISLNNKTKVSMLQWLRDGRKLSEKSNLSLNDSLKKFIEWFYQGKLKIKMTNQAHKEIYKCENLNTLISEFLKEQEK